MQAPTAANPKEPTLAPKTQETIQPPVAASAKKEVKNTSAAAQRTTKKGKKGKVTGRENRGSAGTSSSVPTNRNSNKAEQTEEQKWREAMKNRKYDW